MTSEKHRHIYNELVTAILINIGILLFALLFCETQYEVSDDFVMETILSGAYTGVPNPKIMFVNIILGKLLSLLYIHFPGFSWFMLCHFITCFLSFSGITYWLLRTFQKGEGLFLAILFVTVFSNDAYILVQFTKTASISIFCGSILFLYAQFHLSSPGMKLYGAFLVILGSFFRYGCVEMAGPFVLLILIVEFRKTYKKKNLLTICQIKKILMQGLLLVCIIFICKEFDSYIYNRDEQYSFYREYSSARAKIVDYKTYPYEDNCKELQQINVSENDYYMMLFWNMADNEIFNLEKVKAVGNILAETRSQERNNFYENLKRLYARKIYKYPIFIGFFIAAIVMITFNKMRFLNFGIVIVIMLAIFYYFSFINRMVYRTEYGVILYSFLSLLYLSDKRIIIRGLKKDIKFLLSFAIFMLIVAKIPQYFSSNSYAEKTAEEYRAVIDNVLYYSWDYNERKYKTYFRKRKPHPNLIEEIKKNPDKFYFMDFDTCIQTIYYNFSPFKGVENQYYKNNLYLSGVTVNHPEINSILEQNKIQSPLKSLLDGNVYLIDNHTYDMKLKFLQEHYCPTARLELYKEIDGYKIWKYKTK